MPHVVSDIALLRNVPGLLLALLRREFAQFNALEVGEDLTPL
ncbi:hypothetical protein [Variovorax sp. GT1P44]